MALSSGALFGRIICLMLGLLSLAAALYQGIWGPMDLEVGDGGAAQECGPPANPEEPVSSACSLAHQAQEQFSIAAGVAGVGWLLGAAVFSMGARQPMGGPAPGQVAPVSPGYPAHAHYPAAAPPPATGSAPGYGAGPGGPPAYPREQRGRSPY